MNQSDSRRLRKSSLHSQDEGLIKKGGEIKEPVKYNQREQEGSGKEEAFWGDDDEFVFL